MLCGGGRFQYRRSKSLDTQREGGTGMWGERTGQWKKKSEKKGAKDGQTWETWSNMRVRTERGAQPDRVMRNQTFGGFKKRGIERETRERGTVGA